MSAPRLQLRTPAKLNLFLHITGRRPDGYHSLQTVFRAINLFDQLDITIDPSGAITRVGGLPDVAPEADLAIRAARALQAATGSFLGAVIQVDKHIPTGAGLGGGSSNAAGVLKALNALWRCGLTNAALAEIGLTLGADVPFFIEGGDQWAEGIGEQLQPIALPRAHYVLVHPGVTCPTKDLFANPALVRNCAPVSASTRNFMHLGNVFEPVVLASYPQAFAAHAWLSTEAGHARLTGSGSVLFAEVATHQEAVRIRDRCPAPWRAWFASSIAQ